MSKRSLEKELAESRHFRSRTVSPASFVKLADESLIPKPLWNRFDAVQRTRKRQVDAANTSINDIYLPYFGQTIGERKRMINPDDARHMQSPLGHGTRLKTPANVASPHALSKIQRDLAKQNSGSELGRMRDTATTQIVDMLGGVGRPDLIARIKALSDTQFFALWSIRDTAQNMSMWYLNQKLKDTSQMSADKVSIIDQVSRDAELELEAILNDIEQAQYPGS